MNKDEKRKSFEIKPRRKEEPPKGGLSKDLSFAVITNTGIRNQDTAWLDINNYIPRGDLGMLKYDVVGSWESQQVNGPTLQEQEAWAKRAWRLMGTVLLYTLIQNLIYLEFDLVEEPKWVLENGNKINKGDGIHLVWWNPSIGCVGRKYQTFEA